MKALLNCLALLLGLWLLSRATVVQALAQIELLVLEVSPHDAAAALLLHELAPQPSERTQSAASRDPEAALRALMASGAARALVLDTAMRCVRVFERDGSVRTRLIEGEPTPYLMAFVASELLALDRPTRVHISAAPPAPAPVRHLARFDAQLSADLARAYTSQWVARPRLGLGLWFVAPHTTRALPVVGVELAGPARVQRDIAAEGRVAVWRWDMALRLGVALPFGRVQLVPTAHARAVVQRATFSAPQGSQRALSLGLGAGVQMEVSVTRWLGLCAGIDLGAMPRRSLFTLHAKPVLRESLLFLSASLGLVLHTPWP